MYKLKYNIILIIAYRLLLDLIYRSEIAPYFGYMHLDDRLTIASLVNSWIVLAIISFFILPFLKPSEDVAKSCIGVSLYLIRVVPMTSFMAFMPHGSTYLFYNIVYWVILFLIIDKINFSRASHGGNPVLLYIITLFSILSVLLVSGLYANFRFHFSLADVYDLRDEARTFKVPILLDYMWAATYNIIPVVAVFFIVKKRFNLAALLLFVGVLNFSINGSKSAFFKILICFILYFMGHKNLRKIIVPFFFALTVVTFGIYLLFDDTFLSTLIVRRVFFVPNQLDTFYYDYINSHSPLFFNSEEMAKLTFIIGEESFDMFEMRANNGLFSDAYANLGWIGVFIFPLVVGSFINIFCKICKKHNQAIIIFSSMIVVITLGSSAFTTCLLTHGLFLLLITLYFMPSTANENIIHSEKIKHHYGNFKGCESLYVQHNAHK